MSQPAMTTASLAAPVSKRDPVTPWVVTILAVLFYCFLGARIAPHGMRTDFLNLYTFASTARDGAFHGMYPMERQVERQRSVLPDAGYIAPYVRPPFYALLLSPFSLLPWSVAFGAWVCSQAALLFLIWYWSCREFGSDSLILASAFLPTALGIAHGQDCVFVAAVVLASWLAMERGHDRLAGALAAVALFKFNLILLLPFAMLVRKRWRMLGAFVGVATLEAAISVCLIGPSGTRDYIALLTNPALEAVRPSPERMVNIQALLINLHLRTGWIEALAVISIVAAVLLAAARARRDPVWFWIALAGSIIVTPHSYEYDAALLLPALLISIFRSRDPLVRISATAAIVPLPYLLTVFDTPWAIAPSAVLILWFTLLVRHSVTQWQRA